WSSFQRRVCRSVLITPVSTPDRHWSSCESSSVISRHADRRFRGFDLRFGFCCSCPGSQRLLGSSHAQPEWRRNLPPDVLPYRAERGDDQRGAHPPAQWHSDQWHVQGWHPALRHGAANSSSTAARPAATPADARDYIRWHARRRQKIG